MQQTTLLFFTFLSTKLYEFCDSAADWTHTAGTQPFLPAIKSPGHATVTNEGIGKNGLLKRCIVERSDRWYLSFANAILQQVLENHIWVSEVICALLTSCSAKNVLQVHRRV